MDILIIQLGNYHLFNNNMHVWMECGFKTKNNLRYFDVGQLYLALGQKCEKLYQVSMSSQGVIIRQHFLINQSVTRLPC